MTRAGDGNGESTRDRAGRLARPVHSGTLRQFEEPQDGLTGALPRYTL